jgi:hypothetical protein
MPEGELCPFCGRPKRTEPVHPVTCFMCDMEISHPDQASSIDVGGGETLYFCSIWCFRIYNREEMAAARQGVYLPYGRYPEDQECDEPQ